jgi:hypothetical protein
MDLQLEPMKERRMFVLALEEEVQKAQQLDYRHHHLHSIQLH